MRLSNSCERPSGATENSGKRESDRQEAEDKLRTPFADTVIKVLQLPGCSDWDSKTNIEAFHFEMCLKTLSRAAGSRQGLTSHAGLASQQSVRSQNNV